MEGTFESGIIYACARMVEMFDEPSMAKYILKEADINFDNADEYDLTILKNSDVIE